MPQQWQQDTHLAHYVKTKKNNLTFYCRGAGGDVGSGVVVGGGSEGGVGSGGSGVVVGADCGDGSDGSAGGGSGGSMGGFTDNIYVYVAIQLFVAWKVSPFPLKRTVPKRL